MYINECIIAAVFNSHTLHLVYCCLEVNTVRKGMELSRMGRKIKKRTLSKFPLMYLCSFKCYSGRFNVFGVGDMTDCMTRQLFKKTHHILTHMSNVSVEIAYTM